MTVVPPFSESLTLSQPPMVLLPELCPSSPLTPLPMAYPPNCHLSRSVPSVTHAAASEAEHPGLSTLLCSGHRTRSLMAASLDAEILAESQKT